MLNDFRKCKYNAERNDTGGMFRYMMLIKQCSHKYYYVNLRMF